MKKYLIIVLQALAIAVVASMFGLGVNLVSSKRIPWIYVPPKEVVISGLKIPLVDERTAHRYYGSRNTFFLDTREAEEYGDGHIKGAFHLPSPEKEERFPAVEPLINEDALLILYCHGPECHMAEEVAGFLAQLGYKKMMIMTSGFHAWKKAGYPVESKLPNE
jgi:rhodanese-related sulfurtransferase